MAMTAKWQKSVSGICFDRRMMMYAYDNKFVQAERVSGNPHGAKTIAVVKVSLMLGLRYSSVEYEY